MKREEYLHVIRLYFNQIQLRIPEGKGMGAELGNLLGKSENTIYRKVRGEIGIPIEEYITMARAYGIELPIFGEQNGMLRFSHILQLNRQAAIASGLRQLMLWMNEILVERRTEFGSLCLMGSGISPMHFISDQKLLPLLLWDWVGIYGFRNYSEMTKYLRFPQDSRQQLQSLGYLFHELSFSEYLCSDSLRIHLWRIEKSLQLGILTKSETLALFSAFSQFVDEYFETAEHGETKKGIPVEIYLADENRSQTLLLHLRENEIESAIMNSGHGIYLHTESMAYCNALLQDYHTTRDNSTMISKSGRKIRLELYDQYKRQLKATLKKIEEHPGSGEASKD